MDLNLVRPLYALLEECHVSNAAERCGMSQPAMSRILVRLRALLDDDLLVRVGRGYERTPRGDVLLTETRDVLRRLDDAFKGERFAPASCETRFRYALTDYASAVFLPSVLRQLEREAPKVSLEITAWNERCFEDIVMGRLDAAIMSADFTPNGLLRETLFGDDYVCMVRAEHPIRERRLELTTYLGQRHIVIDIAGGAQPAIDQPLADLGLRRPIGYRTPFLSAAVIALEQTSMILTVPRRLAQMYRASEVVRILEAPREIGTFTYALVSHERMAGSPPHAWLRETIRSIVKTEFADDAAPRLSTMR